MNAVQSEIIDYLLKRLIEHTLSPGEYLPNENELAKRFKTTRINVRRACERLIDMGYISCLKGKGYVVNQRHLPKEFTLTSQRSFHESMEKLGLIHDTTTLACEPMPYESSLWIALGLNSLEHVYKVSRLKSVENEPLAIHISYLPTTLFTTLDEDSHHIHSMHEYFEQKGHQLLTSRGSRLSMSFPTIEEQQLLHCPALVPVILLETDCVDGNTGAVLEVSKTIYKSDRFKFIV